MRGTSRTTLAAAKVRLATALAGRSAAEASQLGSELFAVVGLLDAEPGLRRALSDPSRAAAAREDLARGLLDGKVSVPTLEQVAGLVAGRWSAPGDLTDAAEELAVTAIAQAADVQGQLDETEDDLFRFGRIVQANPALRAVLSNQFAPAEGRRAVVTDLLTGKVTDSALALITQAAGRPRGRSLDASLEAFANLAAELRERLVAEVRIATPLSDEQRSRLATALVAAYGHDVHLNIVIDHEVLGGMTVRIGDQLINGSVAGRLAELRRELAA